MPDRSIWVCPSRYRRLSTASVARPLRQNSKPAIADNALFLGLLRASQVYICRKTFGYLLRLVARSFVLRHGRVYPGHQRLAVLNAAKSWMAGHDEMETNSPIVPYFNAHRAKSGHDTEAVATPHIVLF